MGKNAPFLKHDLAYQIAVIPYYIVVILNIDNNNRNDHKVIKRKNKNMQIVDEKLFMDREREIY